MSATFVKAPTLAARLWPASGLARAGALAVLGTLALTLSAKVTVPFVPVPMTLQTMAVLAIGAAYGPRLGAATVALYLLQGIAGLPVFTNTPPLAAGPLYFAGPTGGFLFGFVGAAFVAGMAAQRGLDRTAPLFAVALVAADAVMLASGWAWLAFGLGLGPARAFAAGVTPFLLGEALKVAVVALGVPAIWAALPGSRR